MQAPWWWSKTETCRSDIYVHFNVNFGVFFEIKYVHFLVVNSTYIKMDGATIKKGLWPVSAPLNLDAVLPRPFLRVSRTQRVGWTLISAIATDNSNPFSFEYRHVFIHKLASSSYNYCLSDLQFRKYLHYEHNIITKFK